MKYNPKKNSQFNSPFFGQFSSIRTDNFCQSFGHKTVIELDCPFLPRGGLGTANAVLSPIQLISLGTEK
jgi:hypothetical protein